jgi:hypothetical protein
LSTKEENIAFEAALTELSRTFIECSDVTPENMIMPHVELLVKLLERKSVFPATKVVSTIENVEKNCVSTTVSLKKEIIQQKDKIKLLQNEIVDLKNQIVVTSEEKCKIEKDLESKSKSKLGLIDMNVFDGVNNNLADYLEQLIDCLMCLDEKTIALDDANKLLRDYKDKFLPLAIKCRLLYKEYAILKSEKSEECFTLQEKIGTLASENSTLTKQVGILQATIDDLSKDPDIVRQSLIQSQRNLIVTDVNAAKIQRQLKATITNLKSITNEKNLLDKDVELLDQAARQTICRLVRQKNELSARLKEHLESHAECVTKDDHEIVQNKLVMLVSKNKVLLERECERIEVQANYISNEKEVQQLREKNAILSLNLQEYEKKVILL